MDVLSPGVLALAVGASEFCHLCSFRLCFSAATVQRVRVERPASTARPSVGMRGERHKAATEAERAMLLEALAQSKGNISKAAEVAGYSRTQFYRLLRKHHITTPGASA